MGFFADYPFWVDALFATFRIVFWFGILFGIIAPFVFSYTRMLPPVDKIIYAGIGVGALIIFGVFLLTVLHIYDLISLILILCLNPLIYNFSRTHKIRDLFTYLKEWELKTLVRYIRFLEKENWSFRNWIKDKITPEKKINWSEASVITAFGAITTAGIALRLFPVLQNAAPLSSGWFDHLNRIKNIGLQDYFGVFPEPGGLHSFVSALSLLTQVSPEMILHLSGGIISFYLCFVIFWAAKDFTKNRYPIAPLAGVAVYALIPLFLMPISLDQEVDAGSLDLALCFAFPTFGIFIRNLRNTNKSPWFYVVAGFVVTAMINLFVAFIILLPMMCLGLTYLPRRNYLRSSAKTIVYLLSLSAINIIPYIAICYYYDIDIQQFVLRQFYNVHVYSYFPFLVLPLEKLSLVYVFIAGGLSFYFFVRWIFRKEKMRDELIFLLIFLVTSSPYLSVVDTSNFLWFDIDQLNSFYAILIAIFISITFSAMLEIADAVFKISNKGIRIYSGGFLIIILSSLIFMQGGLKVSRANPDTIPNGFMEAYYEIIAERQPYTYATVGPKVQQVMAKNRHYFMEYRFFLSEYSKIDSLYQEQLQLREVEQDGSKIPPASIFIFTEKAPYGSIQQGILYNSASVMLEIEEWIADYQELTNRRVNVFYSNSNTTVYELVNDRDGSQIDNILSNIYPPN